MQGLDGRYRSGLDGIGAATTAEPTAPARIPAAVSDAEKRGHEVIQALEELRRRLDAGGVLRSVPSTDKVGQGPPGVGLAGAIEELGNRFNLSRGIVVDILDRLEL